ncbi:complex I NDUFA9 subunit family protein [Anaplasma platys]|nr:complex I NDUFA9 subunit family protein [Anaplasma platys]
MKRAIVFGGSGFIGKALVGNLVKQKYCVNVYTRNYDKAMVLKLFGNLGQVDITVGSLSNAVFIKKLVSECDVVINLVGAIHTPRHDVMRFLHTTFPGNIATLAQKYQKKFVHFSAMGADIALSSFYAQSKLDGERLVRELCPSSIIIRPNLVFGEEDSFFGRFARVAQIMPFLPVFGGGKNLVQPVYVRDVVDLAASLITGPWEGGVHEICGPQAYSLRELMKFILQVTERNRPVVSIPFFMAKIMAFFCEFKLVSFVTQPLTGDYNPLVTRDQIELMKYDLVPTSDTQVTVGRVAIERVVPEALAVYRKVVR